MSDKEISAILQQIKEELIEIKERLRAVEKEQRLIREDILSGEAKIRMQKRMLENKPSNRKELKKKIEEDINIKI